MQVGKIVSGMAVGSLGAVIVKQFVESANITGSAGTIASLFTFVLVGAVALYALGAFGKH